MHRTITRTGICLLGIIALAGVLVLSPSDAAAEALAGPSGPPALANPNLADLVVVPAASASIWNIRVTVTNQGWTSTGPFIVRYQHEGTTLAVRPRSLAPGESVTLSFPHTSLSCAPHSVTVDAEHWVRELSESNNTTSMSLCPGL